MQRAKRVSGLILKAVLLCGMRQTSQMAESLVFDDPEDRMMWNINFHPIATVPMLHIL